MDATNDGTKSIAESQSGNQSETEVSTQPESQLLRKPNPQSASSAPSEAPDSVADERLDLFTSDQADELTKAVADAFSAIDISRVRGFTPAEIKKASEYLRLTAQAVKWSTITKKLKLEWLQVNVWCKRSKAYMELVHIARETADEVRQVIREEEANRRAVEGYLDPIFWDGKKVGTIRRFSDKLMEIQLKAHSAKYREKSASDSGSSGGGIVLNITGVVLGQQPAPQQYGDKTIEIPQNG